MKSMYLSRCFFGLLILANSIRTYFPSNSLRESYFEFTDIFQFPIILFTLIALFGLAYNKDVFTHNTYRVIAVTYMVNSLYYMLMPVFFYWEQTSDIGVDIIIFLITDFLVFGLLWSNRKIQQ
ncbi:DUF2700 domain-containing protein [Vibrio tapetis]|uniref:Uncharacterized protein n=1 Tax=Vibrio tapetis subsp. tapetis TaxID=1671868 RepID=A0A2N8ZMH7_9VIBR|nr:DUF2700 domain-containing protein [Vibrio tapetis]SON53056.1 membrane protein of unknown function [Vibrio tapetis subsp. tapetis]